MCQAAESRVHLNYIKLQTISHFLGEVRTLEHLLRTLAFVLLDFFIFSSIQSKQLFAPLDKFVLLSLFGLSDDSERHLQIH